MEGYLFTLIPIFSHTTLFPENSAEDTDNYDNDKTIFAGNQKLL